MQEGPWPQACAAAKHTQSALKQPRSKAESDDQPLNKVALIVGGAVWLEVDLVDEGSTANPEQPVKDDTRV